MLLLSFSCNDSSVALSALPVTVLPLGFSEFCLCSQLKHHCAEQRLCSAFGLFVFVYATRRRGHKLLQLRRGQRSASLLAGDCNPLKPSVGTQTCVLREETSIKHDSIGRSRRLLPCQGVGIHNDPRASVQCVLSASDT